MKTDRFTRRSWVLVPLAIAASTAGAARANTATEVPPVYHARDVIEEQPARLVGDDAGLAIHDGVLTGRLEHGAYNVQIKPDSARGTGPLGPIDVRIARVGRGFEVAGLWNGGHLHFRIGPDEISGTAMKQISDEERGYQSCRYEIAKLERRPGYTGLSECLGSKPLRFEVQPQSSADLTDEQNAILLVAYFAAPPAVWNP
jgi:hypothetical protein